MDVFGVPVNLDATFLQLAGLPDVVRFITVDMVVFAAAKIVFTDAIPFSVDAGYTGVAFLRLLTSLVLLASLVMLTSLLLPAFLML
jgi:hypothetical protein